VGSPEAGDDITGRPQVHVEVRPVQVNKRVVKAGESLVGARALIAVGEKVNATVKSAARKLTYRVAVSDRDPLYRLVERELAPYVPNWSRRVLRAGFERDVKAPPVQWRYDGKRPHFIEFGGHRVMVEFAVPDGVLNDQSGLGQPVLRVEGLSSAEAAGEMRSMSSRQETWLVMSCLTPSTRDDIVGWVESLADEERQRSNPPMLRLPRWGGWGDEWGRPIRERDPSTLFLPPGMWDGLVADIDDFYASADRYRSLGLPWRRGYLMSGPPGTGKTSTVTTLASHYQKDVWMIPLSDISSDTTFLNLVSSTTGGFLVLEDIDIAGASHARSDDDGTGVAVERLTLAGLLNGIDGLATPEGLVVFMMSNRPDVLDEALIREGRVDRRIEIDYATADQIVAAFTRVYGRRPPGKLPETFRPVGMNSVMEVFKRHLDPGQGDDAWASLLARLVL